MKSISVDYHETGAFSPVVLSYLEQDPKLCSFYNFPPNIDGFKQLICKRAEKNTVNRNLLVQVLKEQYLEVRSRKSEVGSSVSNIVSQNIDLLLKENTYTITTGHQLNIFTGPLYFIYKIATTIKLADDLKKELPEYNFVPVYWMASEDHDFEEINHTNLQGTKLAWETLAKGATGRLDPQSLNKVIEQYQGILGISANSDKLISIIKAAYEQHASLADATRYLVNALFGEFGLVIIDADNRTLKQEFAPVMERDILEQNSFKEINSTSIALQKAGFKTQVHAREINFFYLDKELRERIVYEDGNYFVLNTDLRFSSAQICTEINKNPERFSPNVVMRPLYQEIILPNLAYVGGGAEIVYWLQLKGLFDFYNVDFPVLILRNSALLTDETIEASLQNLDLSFKDLFKETDLLKKDWVLKHSEFDLTLVNEWKELQITFEKIKSKAAEIDTTLAASTEAVRARLHKALLNLEKKLVRAEKRRFSGTLGKIEDIKEQLFPHGGLQERVENFGSYYAKHDDDLIRELILHFKPLDFKFTILY